MQILTPNKIIYSLENNVILPNKHLNPSLGVIIKKTQSSDEQSYIKSIKEKGSEYNVNVLIKECETPIEANNAINSFKQDPGIYGIINLSYFDGATRGLNDMIPTRLDLDCSSSYTLGHLIANTSNIGYRLAPCAAVAAVKILEYEGLSDLSGLSVAILGRSLRVGRPLAEILCQKNATVGVFHSKSNNYYLDNFDIVISAIGKAKEISFEKYYFNRNKFRTKYLIDIGINLDENNCICGDIDIDSFKNINEDFYITPVPGGIGKLATVVLFAKLFTNVANMNEIFVEGI